MHGAAMIKKKKCLYAEWHRATIMRARVFHDISMFVAFLCIGPIFSWHHHRTLLPFHHTLLRLLVETGVDVAVCFTICLFISPDLDGYSAQKMKHHGIDPARTTKGPETQIRRHCLTIASTVCSIAWHRHVTFRVSSRFGEKTVSTTSKRCFGWLPQCGTGKRLKLLGPPTTVRIQLTDDVLLRCVKRCIRQRRKMGALCMCIGVECARAAARLAMGQTVLGDVGGARCRRC